MLSVVLGFLMLGVVLGIDARHRRSDASWHCSNSFDCSAKLANDRLIGKTVNVSDKGL